MSHPHVIVCGSGFAGLRIAKGLQGKADVTVVSPTDRFVYLPLIHEVLSERQQPRNVTKPLDIILGGTRHVHASAAGVEGKELVLDDGRRLPFDRLVVAIGAEPNDFGLPGVREHTYSFYSVQDALMANAALKAATARIGERPLRLVVVGASFTGVEVASEAAELLRKLGMPYDITLLDALPEIFPQQSPAFRDGIMEGMRRLQMDLRTGQRIEGVQEGRVQVAGQVDVEADVIFWCAGARPRSLPGIEMAVHPTLQSLDRDDVYVAGDAARFSTRVPRLAQTAEQQAPIVVHNILHPEDPREYDAAVKGLIVSVGRGYAVAEVAGQVMTGTIPYHVKRQLYKAKIRMT